MREKRLISSTVEGEKGQRAAQEQMQPVEAHWESQGSLLHGFCGFHEGFGCRHGREKQVLHRHLHFPAAIPTLPLTFKSPTSCLLQEGNRPASFRGALKEPLHPQNYKEEQSGAH